MVTMERPIMNHIVSLTDANEVWGMDAAIRSWLSDLLALDHQQWQATLAARGLTNDQIENLNTIVDRWTNGIETAAVSRHIRMVDDIVNGPKMEKILDDWLGEVPVDNLEQMVIQARLPKLLEVLCYAMSQVSQLLESAVAFELVRREIEQGPPCDWAVTPDHVGYGVDLAEVGLAEDAKTWPRY